MVKTIRIIALTLCLAILFSFPIQTNAKSNDDFKYKILKNGTIEITKYKDTKSDLIIPKKIEGRKVTSIGCNAFDECQELKSVSIGKNINNISEMAFMSCINIKRFQVDKSNKKYCSVNGNLYNKNKTVLINYALAKKATEVIIKNSVKEIGTMAFNSAQNIETIKMGKKVKTICHSAFGSCPDLKKIIFSKSVRVLASNAFSFCPKLKKVKIGSGVKQLCNDAFSYCENLTEVTIPKSVTTISKVAFFESPKLKKIRGYRGTEAERIAKYLKIKFEVIK